MDRLKHRTSASVTSGSLRFDRDDARFIAMLRKAMTVTAGNGRAGYAYRAIAMPAFTRPNDPVMAADLRDVVDQTVDECIEAGSAEIVSEFALPIEAHALALSLSVPVGHAEEWISWGPDVLTDGANPRRSPVVDDYVDRQFARALKRPGSDFFSLLIESHRRRHGGAPGDLHNTAARVVADVRDVVIDLICEELASLAARPDILSELRAEQHGIDLRSRERALGAGCGRDWQAHACLVLRSILKVLCIRVERLTLLAGEPDGGEGYRRLLLNFKPLDPVPSGP